MGNNGFGRTADLLLIQFWSCLCLYPHVIQAQFRWWLSDCFGKRENFFIKKSHLIHTKPYWIRCNSSYEFFTHFWWLTAGFSLTFQIFTCQPLLVVICSSSRLSDWASLYWTWLYIQSCIKTLYYMGQVGKEKKIFPPAYYFWSTMHKQLSYQLFQFFLLYFLAG